MNTTNGFKQRFIKHSNGNMIPNQNSNPKQKEKEIKEKKEEPQQVTTVQLSNLIQNKYQKRPYSCYQKKSASYQNLSKSQNSGQK